MSNTLAKSYTYTPYTVSVLVSPAVAAYTTTEKVYSCGVEYTGVSGSWTSSTNENTGTTSSVFVPTAASSSSGGQLYSSYTCSYKMVTVRHEAVAAVYVDVTRYTKDNNLGWNSGGRSIESVSGDGTSQFQVGASDAGGIVGLKMGTASEDYLGVDINYAFYLHSGYAQIMQKGSVVADAGAYTNSTVFQVQRSGSLIRWLKDGEVLATATGAPTTLTWLEASLYSSGDYVDNPSLAVGAPSEGTISLSLALDVLLADYAYGAISLALPRPTVSMTRDAVNTISMELPGLALLLADYAYAGIELPLPAPVPALSSYALITPSVVTLDAAIPTLQVSITAVRERPGTIEMKLPSLAMLLADYDYKEVMLKLPTLTTEIGAYAGAEILGFGSLDGMASRMSQQRIATLALKSLEEETGQASAPGESSLSLAVIETVKTVLSWVGGLFMSLKSLVAPATSWEDADADGSTWACNMESGGSTSYGNFGFNSYARIGDHCFGARDGGLFLLEGDTDDGAQIQSAIGLGRLDFGSPRLKTMEAAYVGMSGARPMVLRVTAPLADGRRAAAFDYRTRGADELLSQRRVDVGRGLKGNYFDVELFNEGGADFTVDTLEFLVADSARRI